MVCSDAPRIWLRAISTLGTGLAVMLGPRVAAAQTFPQDDQWVPLTCDGQVATDPVGDVQPPAIDVVGDAADPAAYVFMDTAWLYLRLRMSATVLQSATTYAPDAWACLVRTAGTPGSYLVWDGVDGLANPNDVALLQNAKPHPGNPTQQAASTVVATYAVATSARQAAATSELGGNPNFFVDWAVALADLGKVGITPHTPVSFICGTSKTEHVLGGDVVAEEQSCGGVLDTVECVGGSCEACTTPTACGPDCVACGGATPVCDPAFGCTVACTTDAECGGATPVCDTGPGRCVGCVSDTNCSSGTTCSTPLGLCIGCASDAECHAGAFCDPTGTCTPCAQGAASCTAAGNGGTGNAAGPDVIEGGSCACDIAGGRSSTGSLAALALGSVAALAMRARRRRKGFLPQRQE